MVRGDSTGDVVFYGKGAGKLPTASAVVADVIDCIKHIEARKYLYWSDSSGEDIIPYGESVTAMYVRAFADDISLASESAKEIFGSIKKLTRNNAENNEIAFVTKQMSVDEFNSKISALENKGIKIANTIRIGDL